MSVLLDALRRKVAKDDATGATPSATASPFTSSLPPTFGGTGTGVAGDVAGVGVPNPFGVAGAVGVAGGAAQAARTLQTAKQTGGGGGRAGTPRWGVLAMAAGGCVTAAAGWLGWEYWQTTQSSTSLVAMAPTESTPAVAPVLAGADNPVAVQPVPAEGGAAPALALVDTDGKLVVAEASAVPAPVAGPATAAAMAPSLQTAPRPATTSAAAKAPLRTTPKALAAPPVVALSRDSLDSVSPASAVSAPVKVSDGARNYKEKVPLSLDSKEEFATQKAKSKPGAGVVLTRSDAPQRLQLAWTELAQGRPGAADPLYRQVLEERPDDADATLGLAVALHRLGRAEEAWTQYQRANRLLPENPVVRAGQLALLAETDPATAESRLRDWVEGRPRDAAAHAALGSLLARQSRWADALAPLTRAQALDPGQGGHAYNLAVGLDQTRQHREALAQYLAALELGGPRVPQAAVRQRIKELQTSIATP